MSNVIIKGPTARNTSRGNLSSNATPNGNPRVIIGQAHTVSGSLNDKSLDGASLSNKYLLKTGFLSMAMARKTNHAVSLQH
jgi:hypothetical protein